MSDLIYRHEAIEALDTIGYDFSESGLSESELEEVCEAVGNVRQDMISRIKNLPSASPDLSTFSDKLWKIAYERGKKEGMQQLHDYQVEWLKSHDDLQLGPQLEKMIIRFLHDTTNCLLMERGDSE